MIRAVTFDFWGTLYRETPLLSQRVALACQYAQGFLMSVGQDCSLEKIHSARDVVFHHVENLRLRDSLGCPADEIGQRMLEVLALEIPRARAGELGELMSSATLEFPPVPVEGAGDVLTQLKARWKLAIISDTGMTLGKDMYAVLERDGLAGLFDAFTFSDQTGTTKPMTRQFLHTLFRLGVMPAQAVHVGDLEQADVLGAHESGMRAVRVLAGQAAQADRHTAAEATVDDIRQLPDILPPLGMSGQQVDAAVIDVLLANGRLI